MTKPPSKEEKSNLDTSIALGIFLGMLGITFGIIMDNMVLGVIIGVGLSLISGFFTKNRS